MIFAAALVLLGQVPDAWFQRDLILRCFVWLGVISYSVYLLHQLIGIISLQSLHIHDSIGRGYAVGIVRLPLLIGLGYLFHLMFERPFMPGRASHTAPRPKSPPRSLLLPKMSVVEILAFNSCPCAGTDRVEGAGDHSGVPLSRLWYNFVMAGHTHGATSGRGLWLSLGLTGAFVAAEAYFGVKAHSLALVSDAGHNVSDALALGLAAYAVWVARRPASPGKTFGYHRVAILTALGNAAALVVIALGILVGAWTSFQYPHPVQGNTDDLGRRVRRLYEHSHRRAFAGRKQALP